MRISIDVRGGKIVGMVEDDGGGFERVATEDRPQHGGLSYMIERAEQHGGTCSVESVPGKGTRVMASFPLSQP